MFCVLQNGSTQFDLIKKRSADVDGLLNERDRNINNCIDQLRALEKERTTLVEACYRQRMLSLRRFSTDAFDRLYEKFLKVIRALLTMTDALS